MADRPPPMDSHDAHDAMLIASLLDRDATDRQRSIGEGRVSSCPECAALHADLVALSKATMALPPAVRTRDFRLTAADAARLVPASAGEPLEAPARLTGEMTNLPTDHATHDELLIASLLDRATGHPDRDRAEALIAACHECAALHRDLVALSTATRALPTPPRPRDFSLSPDDVARLRPMGWRRLLAVFGSSRDMFSRPLAIGLTTLGLVGLLVTTVPDYLAGQGGASAGISSMQSLAGAPLNPETLDASRAGASAGPSAAPPAVEGQAAPVAESSVPPGPAALAPGASPSQPAPGSVASEPAPSNGGAAIAPQSSGQQGDSTSELNSTPGQPPVERFGVIGLAVLLLLLGLGLFALRWNARRLGDG